MRKLRFKLNLQLFAGDEDAILPDDFVDTPPQENETPAEEAIDGSDTEATGEETTPPVDGAPTNQEPTEPDYTPLLKAISEKAKFNKEGLTVDSIDEAVTLVQKGKNYEKAVERARQEARDAWIAEQGYTWHGKPITTEAEYKQALQEKELLEKYADLPEHVQQEMIENRRFREKFQEQEKQKETQAKKDAEIDDFLAYFQSINERPFDGAKDTIPAEVKVAVDKGQPLKFAYMEYHNKELRNRLKIAKQNEANTQRAPIGSVTAHGGTKTEPVDPFMEGFNSI